MMHGQPNIKIHDLCFV